VNKQTTDILGAIFASLIIGGIALGFLWLRRYEMTPLLIAITLGTTFLVCFIAMRQENG
jgi:hypothetical protein